MAAILSWGRWVNRPHLVIVVSADVRQNLMMLVHLETHRCICNVQNASFFSNFLLLFIISSMFLLFDGTFCLAGQPDRRRDDYVRKLRRLCTEKPCSCAWLQSCQMYVLVASVDLFDLTLVGVSLTLNVTSHQWVSGWNRNIHGLSQNLSVWVYASFAVNT